MRKTDLSDDMTNTSCQLCGGSLNPYFEDKKRPYLQCVVCDLVQVPRQFHLSDCDEKAEYDKHENSLDDPGYLRFLSRMAEPMLARVSVGARGLDFGCGPAPALASTLEKGGCVMSLYDKYYQPDGRVLDDHYDFIVATEVVEHLANTGEVLNQLWSLVRPTGFLGLMTKRVHERAAFAQWHYKNDPTHIAFFSDKTFEYLAGMWKAEIEFIGPDVVIFRRFSDAY